MLRAFVMEIAWQKHVPLGDGLCGGIERAQRGSPDAGSMVFYSIYSELRERGDWDVLGKLYLVANQ